MSLAEELRKLVKGEVEDSAEVREKYSRDASLFRVVPEVVVRPKDVEDVKALVSYANGHPGVTLTPRAAGTDMSGGPLTDSVVVDVLSHMNQFLEMGDTYAVAEPGLLFRDFDAVTKERGLEMPGYPASRNIAALGGMVGNNAGGEKHLKYGKTAEYVVELNAVLADGNEHVLSADPSRDDQYVASLRARIRELVSKNASVIEAAKPVVKKNSSGYALWDLGSTTNLARLLVGSQGALGIITKIKMKLVKPKPYSSMVVLFLPDLSELGTIVPKVLKHQPDSFESYDDNTFSLAVKYFPEFAAQMKAGIISLGFAFLPEIWMLLTGGIPKLVLLVEFRADVQEDALQRAVALAVELKGTRASIRIAKDARAAEKFWAIRRESFALLRKKVRGKRTAPFIDDFVVPPLSLDKFLPELSETLSHYRITYTVAGHVGDGNFHIIPLIDPKDPTMPSVIQELSKKVYDLVLRYHGSISGEHNDGLIRTPFVRQMFGDKMYALFEEVERTFDPKGIFNPGKKVGTTFPDAARHLDLGK